MIANSVNVSQLPITHECQSADSIFDFEFHSATLKMKLGLRCNPIPHVRNLKPHGVGIQVWVVRAIASSPPVTYLRTQCLYISQIGHVFNPHVPHQLTEIMKGEPGLLELISGVEASLMRELHHAQCIWCFHLKSQVWLAIYVLLVALASRDYTGTS
jgi:hypothetical protein